MSLALENRIVAGTCVYDSAFVVVDSDNWPLACAGVLSENLPDRNATRILADGSVKSRRKALKMISLLFLLEILVPSWVVLENTTLSAQRKIKKELSRA